MNDDHAARAAMEAAGVPGDLAEHVRLSVAAPIRGNNPRAEVAVGYHSGGRFLETAIVNTETMGDAIALLGDPDGILPLIAIGVRGIPPSSRPHLPEWIARMAAGTARDMRRASRLANDAANGKFADDASSEGEGPF